MSSAYFSMHILVHTWARDRMDNSTRLKQSRLARASLSESVSFRYLEDHVFLRKLLPHVQSCGNNDHSTEPRDVERCWEDAAFAWVFENSGMLKDAEALRVRVLNTTKRLLGQEDPNTIASMYNLALTFGHQDKWKEAEELLVQATEAHKHDLGLEHPDTLGSMES